MNKKKKCYFYYNFDPKRLFNIFSFPDRSLSYVDEVVKVEVNDYSNNHTEQNDNPYIKEEDTNYNDNNDYFIKNDYDYIEENPIIKAEHYKPSLVKSSKDNIKDKYIRLFKTFDAKLIKNNLLSTIKAV